MNYIDLALQNGFVVFLLETTHKPTKWFIVFVEKCQSIVHK